MGPASIMTAERPSSPTDVPPAVLSPSAFLFTSAFLSVFPEEAAKEIDQLTAQAVQIEAAKVEQSVVLEETVEEEAGSVVVETDESKKKRKKQKQKGKKSKEDVKTSATIPNVEVSPKVCI